MQEPVKDKLMVNTWSIGGAITLLYCFFQSDASYVFGGIIIWIAMMIGAFFAWVNSNEKYDKDLREYNQSNELLKKQLKIEEQKREQAKLAESREKYQNEELEKYHNLRLSILDKFKNSDYSIDEIPTKDFGILLKKHQSSIIDIDKNFIHKFVMISKFIDSKKKNISEFIDELFLLNRVNKNEIGQYGYAGFYLDRLKDIETLINLEIHTLKSSIFHSISMITALLKNDLLTFYEIFESFDKLGVFNSNWENDVSAKLSNIEDKLEDLIDSISQLEYRLSNSLDNLSYTTESSFKELNKSVTGQLSEIGSSLKFNNLLTGIQVYQTHKLNKNMKRIN